MMRKIAFIALAVAGTGLAFTVSQIWKAVNPENVKVHFEVVGEGTTGTFSGLSTEIVFDRNDLSKASIKATIDAKSVNTANDGRDNHLRSPDFLEADKYPTISFISDEIVKTDNGFVAKGKLNMKGQTHPVEVPFEFVEDADGKATLKGKMTVKPFQFGVIRSKKGENQEVNITVEVPLSK